MGSSQDVKFDRLIILTSPIICLRTHSTLERANLLTTMTLQNNNFEGSDFQFRDHPRLEHVDMSGNMLLQPFPLDFFKATRLVKFICANCGLTGVLALPNKGVSSNLTSKIGAVQ